MLLAFAGVAGSSTSATRFGGAMVGTRICTGVLDVSERYVDDDVRAL